MSNLATDEAAIAAATSGDEHAFARLAERHRRELHVHSYRMLGNFEDAEDVVQETLVRAWRARDGFAGTGFRAWLYKIATNASLDIIRRRKREVPKVDSVAEIPCSVCRARSRAFSTRECRHRRSFQLSAISRVTGIALTH